MWILDCEGDSLDGKRIWLRPNKQYLFGRTKAPAGKHVSGFAIRHKAVSRKHLTLAVAAVKPGDGSRLDARPEVSLKDEATTFGTKINGEPLRGDARVLVGDEHTFTLGEYDKRFRLKWEPVVLSFTFPSKEMKNGKDPLIPVRSRLEDLGVKTILPFAGSTTHVVSSKRNTAKCLQALINSRYVVDSSFIDAIEYVATPTNLDEPESMSPLEEDFEKHWPDAMKYVPSPGKEPGQRPAELFAPDGLRQQIFHGFVFVFCERRQLENLQAPILDAGGKAVLFSLTAPYTTASDLGRFVEDASEHGALKPLLVKFGVEKGQEHWGEKLQLDVQLILQQEIIEQNEFLDAILTRDAQKLVRKTSSETNSPKNAKAAPQQSPQDDIAPNKHQDKPVDPPKKPRLRGTVRSAFKGFDDGFDVSQIKPERETSVKPEAPSNPRKRTRSPEASREVGDDEFLPATAALKKRKLQEEMGGAVPGLLDAQREIKQAESSEAKSPKKKPALDIHEAVRDWRRAEEEAARRNEEELHQTLSDMSFEEMNNLAKVETMEVREPSEAAGSSRAQKASERWDPRWNGQRNFKRFRRAGEGAGTRRGQTVIVPLEEVKKKSRGVGEHYWLESASGRRRRDKDKDSSAGPLDASHDPPSPSRQTFASAQSHQEEPVPAELADGPEPVTIDVDEPRATRAGVPAALKRQASGSARSTPSKRQMTFAVRDDSDSEDEMKFRFRRRK